MSRHIAISALLMVLLVLASVTASAVADESPQTAERQPWELTLQERLALFNDPDARQERVKRAVERERAINDASPAELRRTGFAPVDVIDGNVNPELIFPRQAFESLMRPFNSGDLRRLREESAPTLDAIGLPDSFFDELVGIAHDHLMMDLEYRFPLKKAEGLENYHRYMRLCISSYQTLNAARDHFGREKFDRFLYEAVVPSIGLTYTSEQSIRDIEFRETGCPSTHNLERLPRSR